jgi:hypothetical protein
MSRLGTVTLQAMDDADVFLKEDVFLDGTTDASELSTEISEPGFEDNLAYVTGKVPAVIPVSVNGDTSVIYGWFKGENFTSAYYLKIYIEYQEVEGILGS